MRTVANRAWWAVVLGMLAAACGGAEGADAGDEFAGEADALATTSSAQPSTARGTSAGSGLSTSTTTLVVVTPSSRTPDTTASASSLRANVHPVGYLINGDSSPDPIPARMASGRADDLSKLLTGADCDRLSDSQGRATCYQVLSLIGR